MRSAISALSMVLLVQVADITVPARTPGEPAGQRAGGLTTTGVAECDEYVLMASACLPRMCEVERGLAELELSFHQEVLSKTLELKGRAEAAKACAQDVAGLLADDPYGCYDAARAKRGMPAPGIRDVEARPAATSVTISFQAGAPAARDGQWEVALVEGLDPLVRYVPRRSGNAFVLDTAVDRPVTAASPLRLDSGVSYCFAITSPGGHERRGTFTTLPRR